MKWMRERDALIAQTLAFVQSVTGRRDAGEPLVTAVPKPPVPKTVAPEPVVPELAPTPPVVPADSPPPPAVSATVEAPEIPAVPEGPRPLVPSDLQLELRARIASFRAHQERFSREREEYFSETLARLRAAIKDPPSPGPRKPA